MFKIKKVLSVCVAAAMLLSTTAFAAEDATVAYGDYTVEVAYIRADSEASTSMAGYMVNTTVPVTVSEDGYTITLDIYNYYSDEMDALGNVKWGTDNSTWTDLVLEDASADYAGEENADSYNRVTITLDSLDTFYMQGNVLVMASMGMDGTQSWRVVPDASSLSLASDASATMNVTATVAKNVSTSSVIIPESTDMGELSKTEDTVVEYSVTVNTGYGQTVTVTADKSVTLTDGDASLTVTNDFDGKSGTLTATAEAVAAVATYESDLNLTGSLSFTIEIT